MADGGLHPNLARAAAGYDDVLRRLAAGRITEREAHTEISHLEARDDTGIRWQIDPKTGNWLRKTAFGQLVADPTPPTMGVATATPFDYIPAGSTMFNPDTVLVSETVDAGRPGAAVPYVHDTPAPAARTSTDADARHVNGRPGRKPPRWRTLTLAVVAVAASILAVTVALNGEEQPQVPAGPTFDGGTLPGVDIMPTVP